MDSSYDWQEIIGTTALFVLLISVVLSLIWRKTFRQRYEMQMKQSKQYQQLAERADERQTEIAQQLAALNERLARIETSNAAIEETLKVVE
jgi:predicted negative regulator of RcsB-dependent stress response